MTQWTDISGNNRHITVNGNNGANISGSVLTSSTGGGLIGGPRPFIYGGLTDRVRFPTTVLASGNNDYTFFHVTRYYVPGGGTPITYAYDDQLTTTSFTGYLSGNSNNGPGTRITSSSANGGYIEMTHAGTSRIGTVYWQLTMGSAWEVDAEIYINPVGWGTGADDLRFIWYATNPITTNDGPTGTNGHGGHLIRWEYYNSDTVEITRCESCDTKCVVEETRDVKTNQITLALNGVPNTIIPLLKKGDLVMVRPLVHITTQLNILDFLEEVVVYRLEIVSETFISRLL